MGLFGNSTSQKISRLEQEIASIKNALSAKVDKISGKGLSANDFTNAYKNKLDSIGSEPVESAVVASGDYITPQMYGAKANGWTDDTEAIQKAIDSGKPVFMPHGRYLISKPLIITNKIYWNFYARNATFVYSGEDYAIRILGAENCHVEIGQITAMNGGGIEFYSDNTTEWNQYVSLEFNQIECRTDCIHVEVIGDGWCNENQVYGGRFKAGENGVHVHHDGKNFTNGWKFYNCGIEGVTNGFLFDANEGEICNMVIANARYGESFETVLKTIGFVFDCLWIAPTYITSNIIDCSNQTSRFEILAPIKSIWDGDSIRHRGCIIDGKLMAEKTVYEEVT